MYLKISCPVKGHIAPSNEVFISPLRLYCLAYALPLPDPHSFAPDCGERQKIRDLEGAVTLMGFFILLMNYILDMCLH